MYLIFNYFVGFMLSFWGKSFGVDFVVEISVGSGFVSIVGIKILDIGMVGVLLILGIVIYIYNRFYDKELLDFIGLFRGLLFVVVICFFVMILVVLLICFIWFYI